MSPFFFLSAWVISSLVVLGLFNAVKWGVQHRKRALTCYDGSQLSAGRDAVNVRPADRPLDRGADSMHDTPSPRGQS